MRSVRPRLILLALSLLAFTHTAPAQISAPQAQPDSDHDGLNDTLEQSLLTQFAPQFMLSAQDCSTEPAAFKPGLKTPEPASEDGTIYGQVTPIKSTSPQQPRSAEIHFFHLWRKDCGGHGHPLDTEHVAVLVHAASSSPDAPWTATYWYAAAHENTVCDVSQIARASTLHAETHGARVWISPGKHASYLNATLCNRGCGADRCDRMIPLTTARLINLGEPGEPMNGSLFIASNAWPLAAKMSSTNFPAAPIARLDQLPTDDIAWFNPGRHPAQGIISISSSTQQSLAGGEQNTAIAISTAGDNTGNALSTATNNTGNALSKTYRNTRHALGTSTHHITKALSPKPKPTPPQP